MTSSIVVTSILKKAKRVAVLTGAGISSESGIPTFRGEGGLWRNFRAEDLATPEAFGNNPTLVWEWYEWRKRICAEASPNAAHKVLVRWENYFPDFRLVTQNVDGLHKRAGSKKITCIHGEIFSARCTKCKYLEENTPISWNVIPPLCPNCDSILRPHIVWFGESYDQAQLNYVFEFVQSCDVFLVIGTSGSVGVPVQLAKIAKASGVFTVEVNPEPSEYNQYMDIVIKEKAGEFLPLVHL